MNERHIIPSDEAEWTGADRYWASVQQFAPRKRTRWPVAILGFICFLGFCYGLLFA